eukprot:1175904-Rhodomonas_salina.2
MLEAVATARCPTLAAIPSSTRVVVVAEASVRIGRDSSEEMSNEDTLQPRDEWQAPETTRTLLRNATKLDIWLALLVATESLLQRQDESSSCHKAPDDDEAEPEMAEDPPATTILVPSNTALCQHKLGAVPLVAAAVQFQLAVLSFQTSARQDVESCAAPPKTTKSSPNITAVCPYRWRSVPVVALPNGPGPSTLICRHLS